MRRSGRRSLAITAAAFKAGGPATAIAYCGDGPRPSSHAASVAVPGDGTGRATARCPRHTHLVFGGFVASAKLTEPNSKLVAPGRIARGGGGWAATGVNATWTHPAGSPRSPTAPDRAARLDSRRVRDLSSGRETFAGFGVSHPRTRPRNRRGANRGRISGKQLSDPVRSRPRAWRRSARSGIRIGHGFGKGPSKTLRGLQARLPLPHDPVRGRQGRARATRSG